MCSNTDVQYTCFHVYMILAILIDLPAIIETNEMKYRSDLIVGVKYRDCMKLCERTNYCSTIRYIKRYPLCTLHREEDNIPSSEPGVTTTRLEKSPATVEVCSVCNDTDFCDTSNTGEVICTPTQCQVPVHIPGAELKGSLLALGSKAQYKCIGTSSMYAIKCLPDGSWSETNLLSCNCTVPDGDHHATTGFEMVSDSYTALTLDCDSGYELLEMDKPKCNLKTGEWFGLDLSGCYIMHVPPWRKIYSSASKPSGSIVGEYLQLRTNHYFINDLKPNGKFRDSYIFEHWSEFVLKRVRFDVVVNWEVVKYMIFNATNSTMETWFSGSRLLESSWTDLDSNTVTSNFGIRGLNDPWNAHFFVSEIVDRDENCELDSGWVVVCWGYYPCGVNMTGLNILYAKGTNVAKFNNNELGFADRFEIWIEE